MDKREMLVSKVIVQAKKYVLGGIENALIDGEIEKLPPHYVIKQSIYNEVMGTKRLELKNGFIIEVGKDIRFLGTEKIKQMIEGDYSDTKQ